jgi:hypothetical protein
MSAETMPADTTLTDLLRGNLLGPTDLAFVSGSMKEDESAFADLLDWLAKRGKGPWWRCLEWTDRVRLEEGDPCVPEAAGMLVWGRWFGAAGDLELWREGEDFRWRFVGEPFTDGVSGPPGQDGNYFAEGGAGRLLRAGPGDVQHILWEHAEARIATADEVTRAFLKGKPRQAAVCTVYYDHGTVAAVQYRCVAPFRYRSGGGGEGMATEVPK